MLKLNDHKSTLNTNKIYIHLLFSGRILFKYFKNLFNSNLFLNAGVLQIQLQKHIKLLLQYQLYPKTASLFSNQLSPSC